MLLSHKFAVFSRGLGINSVNSNKKVRFFDLVDLLKKSFFKIYPTTTQRGILCISLFFILLGSEVQLKKKDNS